jgi:imidazoleglycerol-phosphate dehydratase
MSSTGRVSVAERKTRETEIRVELNIDGTGKADVTTGIGFFDHMLTAWALNGRFDLVLRATGDLHIDQHHTVEDVGIVLGEAFARAVGNKAGIRRYGTSHVPMDEALVRAVLDLSGRAFVHFGVDWKPAFGPQGFDYALASEFFWGFARASAMTIHVDAIRGINNHHLCEGAFKAFGRALDEATTRDERLGGELPSTKGSFDG